MLGEYYQSLPIITKIIYTKHSRNGSMTFSFYENNDNMSKFDEIILINENYLLWNGELK
jgi:choline kinase